MNQPPLSRDSFAVTSRYAYLNHAAVGVLPNASREALKAFVDAHAQGGVLGVFGTELRMPEIRSKVGAFIGASGEDVAILRNTGDGANAIAGGFPFEAGDEVVLAANEFPANAVPWLALRRRGIGVRVLDASQPLTPDRLRAQMHAGTRVVAASWVSFLDGYRHDLAALAEVAHERGAVFVVDAIQGLGAFPLDVRSTGIDALYCGGAKWLMALQGVGIFYVSPELRERLAVASPGWRSVEDMWDFLNYDQPYAREAAKYEGGTPNFIGAISLERSVDTFVAAGPENVARHVLSLTDELRDGLEHCGARVLGDRAPGTTSGIVTFSIPGADPVELGKALQGEGFVTTYRSSGIRVSPHGYNTMGEIREFVRCAGALCKSARANFLPA